MANAITLEFVRMIYKYCIIPKVEVKRNKTKNTILIWKVLGENGKNGQRIDLQSYSFF